MVLTDDDATIVTAVEGGRGTYANSIEFVRFQLRTARGFVLVFLVCSVAGSPAARRPPRPLLIVAVPVASSVLRVPAHDRPLDAETAYTYGSDHGRAGAVRDEQEVTMTHHPSHEDMVRELYDRQAVADVMLRFGRALDLHDWDMYAATMADPVEVDFFDLTGQPATTTTPEVFARFASACLQRLTVMHQYSNFSITLDGDSASGVFYHVSRHRFPNRHGDDHYTQYGWYENSFRRDVDGWRITRLKHCFQWCDGNPGLIDMSDPAWQKAAAEVFGS